MECAKQINRLNFVATELKKAKAQLKFNVQAGINANGDPISDTTRQKFVNELAEIEIVENTLKSAINFFETRL